MVIEILLIVLIILALGGSIAVPRVDGNLLHLFLLVLVVVIAVRVIQGRRPL